MVQAVLNLHHNGMTLECHLKSSQCCEYFKLFPPVVFTFFWTNNKPRTFCLVNTVSYAENNISSYMSNKSRNISTPEPKYLRSTITCQIYSNFQLSAWSRQPLCRCSEHINIKFSFILHIIINKSHTFDPASIYPGWHWLSTTFQTSEINLKAPTADKWLNFFLLKSSYTKCNTAHTR